MGSPSNPHRHPHLAETIDYLRHLGADDIAIVGKKRAHRITCHVEGHGFAISLPRAVTSPSVQSVLARQLVRRQLKAKGVEVRA